VEFEGNPPLGLRRGWLGLRSWRRGTGGLIRCRSHRRSPMIVGKRGGRFGRGRCGLPECCRGRSCLSPTVGVGLDGSRKVCRLHRFLRQIQWKLRTTFGRFGGVSGCLRDRLLGLSARDQRRGRPGGQQGRGYQQSSWSAHCVLPPLHRASPKRSRPQSAVGRWIGKARVFARKTAVAGNRGKLSAMEKRL
jgi:hypothetical protein